MVGLRLAPDDAAAVYLGKGMVGLCPVTEPLRQEVVAHRSAAVQRASAGALALGFDFLQHRRSSLGSCGGSPLSAVGGA